MELLQWLVRVIVSLISLSSPWFGSAGHRPTDRLALLSLKSQITIDPSAALASWGNDSLHFCSWRGVTCGRPRHPERVTSLDLNSLGLSGSISPAIANLTFLANIDLSSNSLQGEIPEAMSRRCSHLETIVLWGNKLQGKVPSNLSRCPDLTDVDLSENELVGVIPRELCSLPQLRKLILYSNHLEGGIPECVGNLSSLVILDVSINLLAGGIPPSLGGLSALQILHLTDNGLTGAIPPSLGALSALTFLDLSQNNLTGAIPPPLWNLSYLTTLQLSTNRLYGALPSDLGSILPRLQNLRIYENQFTGPIPTFLSNFSALQDVELYSNNFNGVIPPSLASQSLVKLLLDQNQLQARDAIDWSFLSSLTNCTSLLALTLDRNLLEGALPRSIANLSAGLAWLTISENQITGSVSAEMGRLVNLTKLDMGFNLLSGSVPASIGMLRRLGVLDFTANKLSGDIPSSLGNLTELVGLYLGSNNFSGSIPAALGECRSLVTMQLSYNSLTGAIPVQVITISTLSRYLSFSDNSLTGSLPSEIGTLKNLNWFDVSSNNLSGEIPGSLGQCQTLVFLHMQGNFFHGRIPTSMSSLRGLQELDVSRNNLSGHIPEFLEQFHSLYYLNLSFNDFDGEAPTDGVFANLSAVSLVGNDKLCGGNLKLNLPQCAVESSAEEEHGPLRVIIPTVLSIILLAFLSTAAYCLWILRRKRLPSTSQVKCHEYLKISYAELFKATDGFSSTNLVGTGSFGSVYKGVVDLDSSRKIVAVKVLNLQQNGASKSFMAECDALRNIRHRNLVKILTSCTSIDSRGNDFKALVFEFMPNGSLEDWLHPGVSKKSEVSKSLNMMQRLDIAIDVASALDYLHHHGQTPIVHCDLKPSNVLLDSDMTAHLADFGLARFLIETAPWSSTDLASSIGLIGSVGYIPPEYGMGNKVSIVWDVYSYGILVLEMFTGKRPTDDTFKEGLSLHSFTKMAFPERVMDIVDPCLFSMGEIERERTHECLVSVLRIGLLCSRESPMERMQMGAVTKEMRMIRDVVLGTMSPLAKEMKN